MLCAACLPDALLCVALFHQVYIKRCLTTLMQMTTLMAHHSNVRITLLVMMMSSERTCDNRHTADVRFAQIAPLMLAAPRDAADTHLGMEPAQTGNCYMQLG